MKTDPNYTKHVFICERCKFVKDGSCDSRPDEIKAFRKEIKEEALKKWPKDKVRINGSGCLGQCDRGISCVVYPEQKWLLDLTLDDKDKVLEYLKSSEIEH